jgi:4'-phosphopantetheinyl transferase
LIVLYLDDHINELDLEAALEAVGPERREYALRYRQEQDRRQCLAAYLLLQRALLLEYGIQQVPPFIYGPNGKPAFDGYPDIHFNLSHCSEAVACVIAPHPVGVDVECIDKYDKELAQHTMNDEEYSEILSSPQPEITFTKFWTMKESLLKLTGEGISKDIRMLLSDAERYRFHTVDLGRYICTVSENSV